jgi:cytochrome c oxidase subunit 2
VNAPLNFVSSAGRVAAIQARLGWWLLVVSVVVVAVVTVLVIAGGLRRRREDSRSRELNGSDVGQQPESGLRWIVVGGMIVPATILVLTFAFTIATENATAAPPTNATMTIHVIGHRWWWEARYLENSGDSSGVVTANEIHVPAGRPVRLELTSDDVIHSFWIPQLAGKTDVIPGQRNIAWIQAERPGMYRGACTEYCGLQHANMASFVVAQSPADFARWLEEQRAAATAPTGAAAAGLTVFETSACASCHAIRGTSAVGRIGPDLTHLGSRATIAAGTLQNTPGNLAGWIANPQSIKPGTVMPTVPLRSRDLQALLAYLGTLR